MRTIVLASVAAVLLTSLYFRVSASTVSSPAASGKPAPGAVPVEDAKPLAALAKRGASTIRQRTALRRFLHEHGVGRPTIAAVLRHTRDGITLWPGDAGSTSHIGGTPVLPDGEEWPVSSSGKPFTFIAAFDLGDLPHVDPLPREGILALYWNRMWMDERGGGKMDFVAATRAYYLAPGTAVAHPAPPRETYPVDAIPLRGTRTAIAGDPSLVADEIAGRSDAKQLYAAMDALMGAGLYTHRLLGAPNEIQGPVLEGMRSFFDPKLGHLSPASRDRYTAQEREHGDWVLLAQIEEDGELVIADGGVLHFVILRSDLEAGRFDRVIGVMESH